MKKHKFILIIVTILLNTVAIHAQPVIKITDKCFGGTGAEIWSKIAAYSDSILVIAGNSNSLVAGGNKTDANCLAFDLWALMVDTALNIKWDKTFGGNRPESAYHVFTIDNGTIILCAQSASDSSCEKSQYYYGFPSSSPKYDYWICAIDSSGNKLWDKTYGSSGTNSDPVIEKLTDGNYIIVGLSDSAVNGDKTSGLGGNDFWAIKIGPTGTKIWDKVYGSTIDEGGYYVTILPDQNGSFILSGTVKSPVSGNITLPPLGSTDAWILKIDSAGSIVWQKRYGGVVAPSNTDLAQVENFVKTSDGGYIFLGTILSQQGNSVSQPSIGLIDAWVVKLDSMGNKQWDKRYGGSDGESGGCIAAAPGGGYYVCVTTQSGVGFDITEPSFGDKDFWLFKIDSAGNKLWDKRFGGPGNDLIQNLIVMPDSSIYMCGYANYGTSSIKTDAGYGLSDYWVVRVKENFAYTNSIHINTVMAGISMYPNPAQNQIQIISSAFILNIELQTTEGKIIQTFHVNGSNANLNTTTLAPGLYVAAITTKEGRLFKKFIKQGL